ncbi:Wadjet anti-phage system protein JetD domain-containing protein [Saccharopolyspora sp. NPDC049426]|uniref:Wadjet anti-phage system protein JetD domain-containing protein n=1 Tax=Saccharopolyspora sp. NPDC049426 TaxID=3155652 RepID=UPI003417D336
MSWTTPNDVVNKLRKRWDRGEFLGILSTGTWDTLRIGLRTPTARDVSERFDETRTWSEQWIRDRRFRIEKKEIGGKLVGANEIPARACVDTFDQLRSILDVRAETDRYTALLADTASRAPELAEWMRERPMDVLRHAEAWRRLVDTALWIDEHARRPMYLREVDVPGVDTKFVEGNRKILAELLDRLLPRDRISQEHPVSDFARRYRFRDKPTYVRFRHLGPVRGFSEMSVRLDELAENPPAARTVFIVENEVSYLALPPTEDAIAIFGGGYSSSALRRLHWLSDRALVYWGDVDTHGYAILNRVRSSFAHTRSVLMNRDTLLSHRAHWVHEPSPTQEALDHLTPAEAEVYADLVENSLGKAVRLEQERISFAAVTAAIRSAINTH